jgi:hypothetical protein
MQHPPITVPLGISRRSFLKASSGMAGGASLLAGLLQAQSGGAKGALMAYVGTFSSPLRDVLPTQVDLPPGNGRGIHLFQADRTTGALTPGSFAFSLHRPLHPCRQSFDHRFPRFGEREVS